MYYRLPPAVLIFLVTHVILAHGSTTLTVYSDPNCQNPIKTYVETDYRQCYPLPSSGSVSVKVQDTYCPGLTTRIPSSKLVADDLLVSIYSDSDCNWNAKLANLNTCTSPYTVLSYSIDCQYPTSTSNPPSTVIAAPAPATSIPSPVASPVISQSVTQSPLPTASIPLAQSSVNTQGPQSRSAISATLLQLNTFSAPSILIPLTALASSLRPSVSTKSPLGNLNSTATYPPLLLNTASLTPTHSTSAPSEILSTENATNTGNPNPNNGSSGGLSVIAQIVFGTLFPVLGIIATVIFGINQWRRKEERLRKRRQTRHDDLISMITRPQGGASISAFRPSARNI